MKKLIAMALASAMVVSMASVAFAATTLKAYVDAANMTSTSKAYEFDDEDDVNVMKATGEFADGTIAYGETAYYPILGRNDAAKFDGAHSLVFEADAVKGLKVKATYDLGKEFVEKTSIVKKKVNSDFIKQVASDNGFNSGDVDSTTSGGRVYAYFVAVETVNKMSTSTKYISGKIELDKNKTTKSTGVYYPDEMDYDTHRINVDLTVEYKPVSENSITVDDVKRTYKFSDNEDEEYEVYLIDSDTALFTVDTRGQGKLVLSANNDFISSIASKYPSANLDFLTVEASASFNKIGELRVYAEEGQYLYAVGADGKLKETNAKYDDSDEAYVIKTRTLGSFVISDTKLNVAAGEDVVAPEVKPETPTTPTVPVNPGTGAAC